MLRKNLWIWGVILVSILLIAIVLGGCGPKATPTPTPMETPVPVSFANPELLVETDWLAEHLDDPDVRIVDARKPDVYKAGHIPGAVNIPRSATFDPNAPKGMVAPKELIEELFGSKGINEKVHVVVYDEGKATAAARVFWTLEYYGHPRVSVLNGGFKKWVAEGREVTTEEPQVTPVTFTAKGPDRSRLSTKEDILAALGKPGVVFVDTRSPAEYRGEDVRAKRGGHIPGAINIDWVENFTPGDVPVLKSPAELKKLYEDAGVTRDKEVHVY